MRMDVDEANVLDVYRLIIGLVVPRPIAWVSTISSAAICNLAPFSFYNAFGANPPVVVFSPTLRRDGSKKDTLKNIEANGEFVINAAVEQFAEQINATSKELAPDESEFEWAHLATEPSRRVRPPRVAGVPFALECKSRQIIPIGSGPISANLVIAEVVSIFVADECLDSNGRPNPRKLQTIARMGGDDWCRTTDLFELPRPK